MVSQATSRGLLDLVQDVALQDRVDVAEEDVLGLPVGGGDLRLEELEDVQVGADACRAS